MPSVAGCLEQAGGGERWPRARDFRSDQMLGVLYCFVIGISLYLGNCLLLEEGKGPQD